MRIALCVIDMLAAVEFDDQPFLQANEVRDVRADRELAPELVAEQGAIAKHRPETTLGIGGLVAEIARERCQP